MKFEYFIFDLLIFFAPILGVKLYRRGVWPSFRPAMYALLIVGLPYLLWDQLVTNMWWTFNLKYISGILIGKLPIEEVLFFCIVPWSCLVIWINIKKMFPGMFWFPTEAITFISLLIFFLISVFFHRHYSIVVSLLGMIFVGCSVLYHHWMQNKAVGIFLLLLLACITIFNGYLTARPVVLYTAETKSNILVGTIPIEDYIYGIVLVAGVAMTYEWILGLRGLRNKKFFLLK